RLLAGDVVDVHELAVRALLAAQKRTQLVHFTAKFGADAGLDQLHVREQRERRRTQIGPIRVADTMIFAAVKRRALCEPARGAHGGTLQAAIVEIARRLREKKRRAGVARPTVALEILTSRSVDFIAIQTVAFHAAREELRGCAH